MSILNREDASDAVPEMFGWAAAVSATSVVAVVCHQHFFFASWRQGLRARAATPTTLWWRVVGSSCFLMFPLTLPCFSYALLVII